MCDDVIFTQYDVTRSMRRKSISLIQDNKWEALFRSTAAVLEQMVQMGHFVCVCVAGYALDFEFKMVHIHSIVGHTQSPHSP